MVGYLSFSFSAGISLAWSPELSFRVALYCWLFWALPDEWIENMLPLTVLFFFAVLLSPP